MHTHTHTHTFRREYTRDFQVETVNFSPTGRVCTAPGCSGSKPKGQAAALLDNVLDVSHRLSTIGLHCVVKLSRAARVIHNLSATAVGNVNPHQSTVNPH
jgi:hypothetical protein